MTEKTISAIEAEAHNRWPLVATLIIHRYGKLKPGDQIVLVAVASSHRKAALEACHFLIDWLKTQAPFWKLEETSKGGQWVNARESDDLAATRWPPPLLASKPLQNDNYLRYWSEGMKMEGALSGNFLAKGLRFIFSASF